MNRVQSRLTIALLFGGLFLLAVLETALVSRPIDFLYRSAAGLSTARSVAQVAVILAAGCLFVTAFFVAVPIAFQATSRFRKALIILPGYLLGFTLFMVIINQLGIGTTGTLISLGAAQLTLASAAIIVGVVLSVIAVVIAVARVPLSRPTQRTAMTMMGISVVPSTIAAIALIISVIIVSTSKPSASFGRPGGAQPAGQTAPATQSASAPLGGPATQGAPAAAGTQAVQGPSTANQAGAPAGLGGPGGGGSTSFVGLFTAGGVFAALFAIVALVSTVNGLSLLRGTASSTAGASMSALQINYSQQAGSVVAAIVAVSLVIFVVIQFVPVSRDNPPVQAAVQWDSPQTEQLWTNACADCHSNTTKWPWYSYVAPSSWLQAVHVTAARKMFNISELNTVSAARKAQLPDEAEQQIKRGDMPPSDYLIMHPEARLSDTQKQQLIDGLKASLSK